ncbi:hypothetical protein RND81_08G117600 [Saponaria officinalis]|uniref:Neprosin PEP catalytic domain-containing protein n=1 Tax=Saponaria officinalis TaxID=3572 RepID=A0AAW1J7R1_SAPOF
MASAKILCCLPVIVCIFLHSTEGRNSKVSQKKFHESQRMKTIKTKYGDTYDCVDFYEQPAFKHSQLKNHKFYPEMRPKFLPNFTIARNDVERSVFYILENGGCPRGTVPIRRISKEDRSQEATFSKTHIHNNLANGQITPPGTHFAISQTKSSPGAPPNYYGVGAQFSVWNPQVKENQYSAAQLTIQNGPDSLQVGWMVNPTMYKDTRTHMFIHTNAGESQCYNTYCSGFVLVRSDFPPDIPMIYYSKSGKDPVTATFFIHRDPTSGAWWLRVTHDLTPIGFWPDNIFRTLNKFGTYISCGGETYSPPDQPGGYPPMGNGEYPIDILERSAFAIHFETVDDKLKVIKVDGTEKFMDTKKYSVHDYILNPQGHVVFFGGYGG